MGDHPWGWNDEAATENVKIKMTNARSIRQAIVYRIWRKSQLQWVCIDKLLRFS